MSLYQSSHVVKGIAKENVFGNKQPFLILKDTRVKNVYKAGVLW